MFVRHLKVFHQDHKQYLTHLTIKTKLIIGIINEDITIKQLNPDGTSVVNDKKKPLTDEENIMKYVGNNIDESMNDELATIVSNISTSSDGSDEDTTRGLYNNSSNSIISVNKPVVSEPKPQPKTEAEPQEPEPQEPEPQEPEPQEPVPDAVQEPAHEPCLLYTSPSPRDP